MGGGFKFAMILFFFFFSNGAFLIENNTNRKRILAAISTTEKKNKKGLILSQTLGACLLAPLQGLHRLSCHQNLQALRGKVACSASKGGNITTRSSFGPQFFVLPASRVRFGVPFLHSRDASGVEGPVVPFTAVH